MPLFEPFVNYVATLHSLWTSPVALVPIAVTASYGGWRIVEFIPFTRRIIDRREGADQARMEG